MSNPKVSELLNLTGKVALVTGGAMGIGAGIARRLAEAGASVMFSDVEMEVAQRTVEEIRAAGGKAATVRADASNLAEARRASQATVEAFGGLDILVNNAGVYPIAPVLELSEESWDKVLDTNLKGVFFHAQAAAQLMVKQGRGGRIVNISSVDAYHPNGHLAHYDASKGGVVMLTKSLALELAPHNILVNAIAPGGVDTEGSKKVLETYARAMGPGTTAETFKAAMTQRIPLRRMATPDDIARMVLCLVAAPGDYMTGTTVLVDGGMLLS
jgi:2-deoxy-D-gluconate 3-dehydrogenase